MGLESRATVYQDMQIVPMTVFDDELFSLKMQVSSF